MMREDAGDERKESKERNNIEKSGQKRTRADRDEQYHDDDEELEMHHHSRSKAKNIQIKLNRAIIT